MGPPVWPGNRFEGRSSRVKLIPGSAAGYQGCASPTALGMRLYPRSKERLPPTWSATQAVHNHRVAYDTRLHKFHMLMVYIDIAISGKPSFKNNTILKRRMHKTVIFNTWVQKETSYSPYCKERSAWLGKQLDCSVALWCLYYKRSLKDYLV